MFFASIIVAVFGLATAGSTPAAGNSAPVATSPPNTVIETISGCTNNYTVQSGDTCESIAKANSITVVQFEEWNPAINSNCTNIQPGAIYCVAGPASGGTTNNAGSLAPATTSEAPTATSAPNVATGIASTDATTITSADTVTVSEAPVAIATVTYTVSTTSSATSATDTTSATSTTSTTTNATSTTNSTATTSSLANSASTVLQSGQEDSSKPTPVSTGSGSTQTGACTTEGMWNCIGGSSFQQCASGMWSDSQPMAAGTTCQAGQNMNLGVAAKRVKPRGDVQFIDASPHDSDDNTTSKPPPTSPPTSTPPPPPPPASTPPPPPGFGSPLAGPCTPEGLWNCIGGSSFQQCASGSWSASQPVAAGTTCQAGKSMDLGIAKPKRAIRFSGEHVHMREAF